MTGPLTQIPASIWIEIVKYLTLPELKTLRLIGNKEIGLANPSLTSHLQLKMSKVPFFIEDCPFSEPDIRRWLDNRGMLLINDVNARICPRRVAYLVAHGYLDSICQIVVLDCHVHWRIMLELATLPNVVSLKLIDQGNLQGLGGRGVQNDLEMIVASLERMRSLQRLEIEFDCVISGIHLSCLRELFKLQHLRLRGFDLSDGIQYLSGLISLESLHLCHGNFYSSPEEDVNERDLLHLVNLRKLKRLHLEGFDCLSEIGLKAFSSSSIITELTLRHCQEMNKNCLSSIGRMTSLKSLHIVNSVFDDIDIENFESENWIHLNILKDMKCLSLFYVLVDQYDLLDLSGLTSLETLNVAFHDDIDIEGFEALCQTILPVFGSLKKLRIFAEDSSMDHTFERDNLEIQFASFNLGDEVELD